MNTRIVLLATVMAAVGLAYAGPTPQSLKNAGPRRTVSTTPSLTPPPDAGDPPPPPPPPDPVYPVTFSWSPADSLTTGYRVVWGTTPGLGTNSVDVGLVTNVTFSWPKSTGRYVSVLAYAADGTLSDPSATQLYWPLSTNVVTVTAQSSLSWATNPAGPWTVTGTNQLSFTDPIDTKYFRGVGARISHITR